MAYELSLAGKAALVTGAARGIGRGVAVELARAGADVCMVDLGPASRGDEVLAAVRALGRRAVFAPADVSDRAAVDQAVARCEAELGPVQILVHAAIRSVRQDLLETDFNELARTVEVGIYGTFHLFQAVARRMVAQGIKGSMIYITSPHARLPFKGAIDYNIAKSGAHMLALSAANELMWYGIRVNLLEPGWTDTPGERTWYSDEVMYGEGRKMPLGRLASPEDLGRAAVFLSSDQADYIAGAVLPVDGGAFIQGPAWTATARHGES